MSKVPAINRQAREERHSYKSGDEKVEVGGIEEPVGRVLLAGLGALAKARVEGRDLFESLVDAGRRVKEGHPEIEVTTADELRSSMGSRIFDEVEAEVWKLKFLKSGEVARALGLNESNREKARSLRERSSLLGIPRDGGYLYPTFQIDSVRRQMHPEVQEANEELGASDDPWGVASWWLASNDRIGGIRPIDLVGTSRREDLVRAARAVTEPIG